MKETLSERLLLLTDLSDATLFAEDEVLRCLEALGALRRDTQIEGELAAFEFRFAGDVAHMSVDANLRYLSVEARDAGYMLAFQFGKRHAQKVYVVRGDNLDSATSIEDCDSVAELRNRLGAGPPS